ncbi:MULTISPECIES: hypothetical protein [Streptomyces]|uniref:Uncharacterized protein n=1 Tax=Streptomyces yangpuensis TaxID=1648182 RepID=A0ABY5Q8N8_9ACTN|nr:MULTISPECIES: hypothetical protein [Streptomyces]MBZ9599538.1 hypothetical protein [Streptomyces erythrochromogenes]UUY52664.1 hypothetical protein NRK68_36050 [Streptomyces yangpuensis]
MADFGEHMQRHAPSYVGLAAVIGTVVAGYLQADGVLETGRAQARSTLEAARTQAAGQQATARTNEQITRYGELIQASSRVRFLMQRFERLDEQSKRDPAVIASLRQGNDDLVARAASAAVILGSHPSDSVRVNAHGIAYTLPYAARCLETGLPGSDQSGYRVDYPGKGLMDCAELATWLDGHEKALAKEPPSFS